MNDFDRSWLMSRTGMAGGSVEQLVEMAYAGNVDNLSPYREPELDSLADDSSLSGS